MKKGFTALKNGTWEEYQETFKEKDKGHRMGFQLGPALHQFWWVSGGKSSQWWSNRLLVIQTGDSIEQAKVFKTHPYWDARDSLRLRTTSTQWNGTGRLASSSSSFFEERADGHQGAGSVWAQRPS